MNTVTDLVIACRQRGIVMVAEGEALRVEGPDETLTEDLLSEIKEHKPELLAALNLDTLLTEACQGVEGIDAATYRTLLSPEDVQDIVGGCIPVETLRAYAKSFSEGILDGRITVLAPAIPKPTLRVRCADCRHFIG